MLEQMIIWKLKFLPRFEIDVVQQVTGRLQVRIVHVNGQNSKTEHGSKWLENMNRALANSCRVVNQRGILTIPVNFGKETGLEVRLVSLNILYFHNESSFYNVSVGRYTLFDNNGPSTTLNKSINLLTLSFECFLGVLTRISGIENLSYVTIRFLRLLLVSCRAAF